MLQLKHEFILASESPRRKELLEKAGFSFAVLPVKVSENLEKNLNLDEALQTLARKKAKAAQEQHKYLKSGNFLILAADTMVILDGHALGKPATKSEAEEILGRLSGQKHEVKTAICLLETSTQEIVTDLDTTAVYFRPILRQEILDYIATGEPMDKAGAYGIQGLGGKFVEKIEGQFDNVVGLPVEKVKLLLKKNKWMKEET